MPVIRLVWVGVLVAAVLPVAGRAQQDPPDFFEDRSVLELVLVTDLPLLFGDRGQESPDRPAEVGYFAGDGTPIWIPIDVRTRGKFRLDEQVCPFPPIRLDFPSRRIRNTVFDGQNTVKMVTHCQAVPVFQQHVILEYLAYRIYELLTPKSFRTRLAKVTYVDASEQVERMTRYAFLIEHVDDVAFRNQMAAWRPEEFHGLLVDAFEMGVHDVFQFMIGNTDWSMFLNQNVEFMTSTEGDVSVVPFDFDWAGLVAAPYAQPAPDVPIENVRERFYMGVCRQEDHLTEVFELFLERRSQIEDLYRNEPALSETTRSNALTYIDEFYQIIVNERSARTQIREKCRV